MTRNEGDEKENEDDEDSPNNEAPHTETDTEELKPPQLQHQQQQNDREDDDDGDNDNSKNNSKSKSNSNDDDDDDDDDAAAAANVGGKGGQDSNDIETKKERQARLHAKAVAFAFSKVSANDFSKAKKNNNKEVDDDTATAATLSAAAVVSTVRHDDTEDDGIDDNTNTNTEKETKKERQARLYAEAAAFAFSKETRKTIAQQQKRLYAEAAVLAFSKETKKTIAQQQDQLLPLWARKYPWEPMQHPPGFSIVDTVSTVIGNTTPVNNTTRRSATPVSLSATKRTTQPKKRGSTPGKTRGPYKKKEGKSKQQPQPLSVSAVKRTTQPKKKGSTPGKTRGPYKKKEVKSKQQPQPLSLSAAKRTTPPKKRGSTPGKPRGPYKKKGKATVITGNFQQQVKPAPEERCKKKRRKATWTTTVIKETKKKVWADPSSDTLPCRFCGGMYHIRRLNQHQIGCQLKTNSTIFSKNKRSSTASSPLAPPHPQEQQIFKSYRHQLQGLQQQRQLDLQHELEQQQRRQQGLQLGQQHELTQQQELQILPQYQNISTTASERNGGSARMEASVLLNSINGVPVDGRGGGDGVGTATAATASTDTRSNGPVQFVPYSYVNALEKSMNAYMNRSDQSFQQIKSRVEQMESMLNSIVRKVDEWVEGIAATSTASYPQHTAHANFSNIYHHQQQQQLLLHHHQPLPQREVIMNRGLPPVVAPSVTTAPGLIHPYAQHVQHTDTMNNRKRAGIKEPNKNDSVCGPDTDANKFPGNNQYTALEDVSKIQSRGTNLTGSANIVFEDEDINSSIFKNWKRRYKVLEAYCELYNGLIPVKGYSNEKQDGFKLGPWVLNQKTAYWDKVDNSRRADTRRMSQPRVDDLEKIPNWTWRLNGVSALAAEALRRDKKKGAPLTKKRKRITTSADEKGKSDTTATSVTGETDKDASATAWI